MNLRPCANCRFHDPRALEIQRTSCPEREAMRAKLIGTGVTSVTWPCAKRMSGLEPGAVFLLSNRTMTGYDYSYGEIWDTFYIRGIVMRKPKRSDGKFMAWLLGGNTPRDAEFVEVRRQFCYLMPGLGVQPTGEIAEICADCGKPAGTVFEPYLKDGRMEERWNCDTCNPEENREFA